MRIASKEYSHSLVIILLHSCFNSFHPINKNAFVCSIEDGMQDEHNQQRGITAWEEVSLTEPLIPQEVWKQLKQESQDKRG